MAINILITLKLANKPGQLAQILNIVSNNNGSLGAIDLLSASPNHTIRELMIRLTNEEQLKTLIYNINALPGVEVLHVVDRVFASHLGGKIEVTAKRHVNNWEDLSIVYTPGVAKVSAAIAKDWYRAYHLTMKGNTVAIVTDGSAILGLGNLGPAAALPVMEGKAALFKQFANINAVPLCLDVQDQEAIINTVKALAPSFGGINLEDIAAPKCFEIEQRLSQLLDIPVFHDDQHGTAVVTLAGLINALQVVDKKVNQVKVVISGAGAAGIAITKLLLKAGFKDIIVCDRQGAIARTNAAQLAPVKAWIAKNTNHRAVQGPLTEVLKGADVFIGVSAAGLLQRQDILNMAAKPIVFALANPEPEINPELIQDLAAVIATGRSDYPNQINNALVFPGIFRGALDCHAKKINTEMCLAAAYALAGIIPKTELSAEHIIPSIFNSQVAKVVAAEVATAARQTGVAQKSQ